MAELWLLRVAGAGEGARAEICAFSGLYFFLRGGGDLRDASVKDIRYFNCLFFPRGRGENRDP